MGGIRARLTLARLRRVAGCAAWPPRSGQRMGARRPLILSQLGCGVGAWFVARICARSVRLGQVVACGTISRARGRRVRRGRGGLLLQMRLNRRVIFIGAAIGHIVGLALCASTTSLIGSVYFAAG